MWGFGIRMGFGVNHLCENLASPHMRLSETSLSCELVMFTPLG